MKKKAILYARVSTHNQIDNTSLDYQIEQCKQYAIEHGMEIVREIKEQESGAYSNRGGLNAVKEMGKQGLADCVIVYKMDRFMRGDDAKSDPGIDAAITERELNRAGLDVIFLDLPPKDSEAYAWIKAIKRIVASVERVNIRTRFENGKAAALANGKPAHGGRPPLGYKRNEAGYFEIVESEASAIRLIYDLYLSGKNVPTITDYLREHKIPGYRGSKKKWGDWIVYAVLRRECYYGRYAIVTNRSVKDETRANGHKPERLPKEEWVYVDVPAIVTKEEWDRVQERKRKRVKKRKTHHCFYLLTGRLSCECDYAMVGYSSKSTRKDGSVLRTRYYMCKGKTNRYALNPCDTKGIRADKLENTVYQWVERVISDPDFIQQLYEKTLEKCKQNELPLRERLDAVRIEKLQAERRLKKVAQLMMDASEVELSIYQPEVEKLRGTIDYLANVQTDIEAELEQVEADEGKFRDFLQYVSAVQTVISNKRNDRDFKMKAIRAIDLKVVVSLDRQSVSVSCVVGSDIVSLYEKERKQQQAAQETAEKQGKTFRITNESRRRCTTYPNVKLADSLAVD